MKLTNRIMRLAVSAALIGGVSCANAGTVFQFDTSAVAGNAAGATHTFLADEMTTTSAGVATITQTDSSAPFGVFGAADDFVEIGLVSVVNFQLGNNDVFGSGVNSNYKIYADYTLFGTASLNIAGDIIVSIIGGSGNLYYQESGGALLPVGGNVDGLVNSARIGTLTSAFGDCNITAASTLAEGSCKVAFDFDFTSVTDAGVFTTGGTDLGDLGASFLLDINVDKLTDTATGLPPTGTYAGFGGACDPGMNGGADACVANLTAEHDGSGEFSIPEPGTLALLGMGLLGLGRNARRKT